MSATHQAQLRLPLDVIAGLLRQAVAPIFGVDLVGNQVSVFLEGLEVPGLAPTTSTPPRRSTLGTLAPPPALQGATPAEISAELQCAAPAGT